MPAIEVVDLTMTYGELRAVDGVSLSVGEGEFVGILGPSGAGKTTLLEMVEGLRRPVSGTATVLDEPVWPRNAGLLPRIGVQLQASSFFERLTAREQIRTFAALYGVAADHADQWLERVGLVEKADSRVEELSGGQAQRLSIACALVHGPEGWRQSKLLRRLQLAPVSTRTVVGARVSVTVAIFLGIGTVFFGLTLTGAWWAGVPLLVVGTLCFMSIGLLAGAITKTQEGAVNAAKFLVLPMAFLSGSFFPLDAAPGWLRASSQLLPLRHLNDGMLDVMVRGEPWTAGLAPMGILAAFTVVVTLVAARLFRWETT